MQKIILQLLKEKKITQDRLGALKRQFSSSSYRQFPTAAELFNTYRQLARAKKIKPSPALEKILRKRNVRTLSGVAVITVLTKPWSCPGHCVYCPNDIEMPKSYLKNEPAAQRAYLNNFDPYNQVLTRLLMLWDNGHKTDKIELIIKGGSWNSYPLNYQLWFIKECFRAVNNFKTNNFKTSAKIIKQNRPRVVLQNIKKLTREILTEQKKNEHAQNRVVGLTLETRPDLINKKTIAEMRLSGATRIELGVQHTDEKILKLIKRGHNLQAVKNAVKLLRQFGFKIDFHLMPQLPGSTPAKDLKMFAKIFSDIDLRPDMIKIYPCSVVKKTELYNWFKKGLYKPYSNKKLFELLIKVKSEIIPRYCRISRLIRDIPSTEIIAGNKITNLREFIKDEMKKRGLFCKCLRCREIGHQNFAPAGRPKLFIEKYETSGGTEYFLTFEDIARRAVYSFCRLRIDQTGIFPAFIRELHTYGQLVGISAREKNSSQHKGFGRRLVETAEKIACQAKAEKIAVISGVGARGYYKKLGYKLESTYMVKNLLSDTFSRKKFPSFIKKLINFNR